MAGKTCPKCKKQTFFETPDGRECTKCGAKMILPVANGAGGPGKKCTNCGKMTVHNNRCSSCGVSYKF